MSGILNAFVGGSYGAGPVNTVAPVVSGTATVGQVLSTTNGTWTGVPTPTYTYQWQRNGSNIGSATASTYTLVAGDVGFTIRCVVTATNAIGSTSANSNSTAAVSATVPSAPTIGTATATSSTTATVTYTASASNGGATITSYTAVSSPGGITGTLATSGSGTITVSGLSPTTSYTFTVYATNSVGNSASSAASNSITTSQPAWIGLLGGSNNLVGTSVALDSSGNMYLCGYLIAGSINFQLAKYNSSGTIQWQRSLGGTGSNYGQAIAVDSSSNVYVSGYSTATGDAAFEIAKYNTSGTIQFQRRLGGSGSSEQSYGIALDSSANIYVGGLSTAQSGNNDWEIAKYNSSGTIQWQRYLLGGSSNEQINSIAIDSSGNAYVCGYSSEGTSNSLYLVKLDTSGALQWQRKFGSTFNNEQGYGVALDSSNNVYVCGFSDDRSGTDNDFLIAKYNSSGTIQWQRRLGSNTGTEIAFSVAVDSSDNLYICGQSGASGSVDCVIAKYNSSGTIQWQRTLSSSSPVVDTAFSIAVSSSYFYICGRSDIRGGADILFAKLPVDGSLTGTYSVGGYSFTYAASSFVDAATTLTDAAGVLSNGASTLTGAVTTLTDSATSLTSSVTVI